MYGHLVKGGPGERSMRETCVIMGMSISPVAPDAQVRSEDMATVFAEFPAIEQSMAWRA